MRIAVHSRSVAITRVVTSIITQAGHHVAADGGTADFVVVDGIHPTGAAISAPCLHLVAQGAIAEQALACPLRPQHLLQRLMMLENMHTIALANHWQLDMQARMLGREGEPLPLTEKECALLKHLAQAHPRPLTREDLLAQVWGMAGDVDTHTLETHIYRLRAKLEALTPPACDIRTEGGAYLLVLGGEENHCTHGAGRL